MKSKYEISIWSDEYSEAEGRFIEHKEAVIGSDTMTSENRARNPKLINNINGTNKFSFDLYYRYIDTRTGEEVENPYIPYLVNERKIKVLWKGEWYDLLIKDIKEDQAGRVFSYTCEDSYITELSRSGYELVFATELENSIGTARELIGNTVENTDWQFDEESDQIYQLTEEPVYESKVENAFEAIQCVDETTNPAMINQQKTLEKDGKLLIYYSFAPNAKDLKNQIQVYYVNGEFETNNNEMLVTNGACYNVKVDEWRILDNKATAIVNGIDAFIIDFNVGLSEHYRAERYVDSQKTLYSDLVSRYVNVYTQSTEDPEAEENIVYGYQTTEFTNPLAVVNLVINPCNFQNISGWTNESDDSLMFKIWPAFDKETDITTYEAKSFLHFAKVGTEYINSGIQNNRTYIPNGFIKGEQYVCRVRAVGNKNDGDIVIGDHPDFDKIENLPNKYIREDKFVFNFSDVFQLVEGSCKYENNWLEYTFECIKSCSYNDLLIPSKSFELKIKPTVNCWVEEIQFYPVKYGDKIKYKLAEEYDSSETYYIKNDDEYKIVSITEEQFEPNKYYVSYSDKERINPNELDIQSVAQVLWKYFSPSENKDKDIDDMTFLHVSTTPWEDEEGASITPIMNNYVSYAMIEESQSNRFNILQSIAEKFKGWVRFRTVHDPETGAIIYNNGRYEKYVGIYREAGQETGIGFIYGVDLKGVTRNIKSDKISTKTIVMQNENEFGKNGFCTIARSQYNYPKENTIFNFDYYIQHGLLQRDVLQKDLYNSNTDSGYICYYTRLHDLNTQYENNLEELLERRTELTREEATYEVYNQYVTAAENELNNIKDNLMKLAGVDSFENVKNYANTHLNNTKVVTLLNSYAMTTETRDYYQNLIEQLQLGIDELKLTIYGTTELKPTDSGYQPGLIKTQEDIIEQLRQLNTEFYKKYARFIQEGTWTSEDYWDDDLYYLDAFQVAYESSRPQITYEINVLRISETEDYSSKIFKLGDISFIQDVKYFGYQTDGITPYKERVVLTEITSFFDTPDKDAIKVQNYKNQFDDLFQRITAATQNLEFSQGKYARVSDIMADDGTIKSSVIQKTFESNKDLVYGAQNESVTMDNTGITVVDDTDATKLLKVTSGGVFVSADGGETWKNAVRGDGINTELLTAGRINTEDITVYNGEAPGFRWDGIGLNAYEVSDGQVNTQQGVRFDQYGMYGIKIPDQSDIKEYIPSSLDEITDRNNKNVVFGFTWDKFFMRGSSQDETTLKNRSIEITSQDGIRIYEGDNDTLRIAIGSLPANEDKDLESGYGMRIQNSAGQVVFESNETRAMISGWELLEGELKSDTSSGAGSQNYISIKSEGSIGSYGLAQHTTIDDAYEITSPDNFIFHAKSVLKNEEVTFSNPQTVYIFTDEISSLTTIYTDHNPMDESLKTNPPVGYTPSPSASIYFAIKTTDAKGVHYTTYELLDVISTISLTNCNANTMTYTDPETGTIIYDSTYEYSFSNTLAIKQPNGTIKNLCIITTDFSPTSGIVREYPAGDTEWYIDKDGAAVFYNITANGGKIAGWWIDEQGLYQTYDGTAERDTSDKKNGNVKYSISVNKTSASDSDKNMYNIITDAINAAMATLGGVILSNGLVNGYRISDIAKKAEDAYKKADGALTKSRADGLYASKSHQHKYTYYSYGDTTSSSVPSHYHRPTSHTANTQ